MSWNHPDALAAEDAQEEARAEHDAALFAEEVDSLTRSALLAASIGDVKAPALFAPWVHDFTNGRRGESKRNQTVGEVISEGLAYADESGDELLALLCRAAKGEPVQAAAAALLGRAAAAWADMTAAA